MKDAILLTGGTGFLGTELAGLLIRDTESIIYVLTRAAGEEDAAARLKSIWYFDKELISEIGQRVIPVTGDFTKPGLGLTEETARRLSEEVMLVIHAGAETGFQESADTLGHTNISGTRNMLMFSEHVKNLRRFVYISTAYVSGQKKGTVTEEEPTAQAFSSLYESSKAAAEKLVRASGLPFVICRPGMIVGNSATGRAANFNTVYYVLKLMLLKKMRVLPIKKDTKLNIVPVDYVAESVLKIACSEEAEGKTFHLTCPEEAAPEAGEMYTHVRAWAKENLSADLPAAVFAPMPALKAVGLSHNREKEGHKKNLTNNLLTILPYFYADQTFDRTNTDSVCGPYDQKWEDYLDGLLAFACRKNFMKQTGQTVFEQACVRRASTRYPMKFFDVNADGIHGVSGKEVNRRVEKIRSAMWVRGIRSGDRIAITGINSVDYLCIEQAIGLMGAVSVPIYYTTPVAEAQLLLQKSGAKWFFVGDKRMMQQVEEIETDARIVSFSTGESVRSKQVMSWRHFIRKAGETAPRQHPDPDTLATIRYTSGTTGEPKGVMFSYSQLAWMGEILTNLLPREDRNRSLRYLSFLPLSHVVEGILASYAPYYCLCNVEYYYLNDFGSLTDALPLVRPNVFFSVPRFYEKVWAQVAGNPIGKAWLASKDGMKKKMMGEALRRVVLKKAGIDKCKQLIVGSAPVSEALLLHFRELGIEIHNAYGQTEAPLITINRLGDNVIPTIGTPLPDTTVTAEPDGELIVKGPQVALGYYGLETETIKDGVLRTGDLGTIDENGHITLFGRKKDFIVTSYGKNISIPKIEERLKDIPGVSEAVLIGENRPYCTALLWTEQDIPDLDAKIEEMNESLSHPEQIRFYRVIDKPLSIKEGELTPNLKVKRANVEKHLADVIEEMYR